MSTGKLHTLKQRLSGELFTDDLHKIIYATDASVYRELPLGVVYPKNDNDIVEVVRFCHQHSIPMIPRAGGTSLAGQCVGEGVVVDVSKYMNKILHFDQEHKTVTVQPGVIRDELNHYLRPFNLMFGPNTSTANRATIGGMVGNNSCGSTSIVFGSTRDHVVQIKAILSDGSEASFQSMTPSELKEKCRLPSLEGTIYRHMASLLEDTEFAKEVADSYPKPTIKRRNTGYALDALFSQVQATQNLNLSQLLCGSEGTLAFVTEITLGLVDTPPPHEVLVAVQFDSIDESMKAVPYIMHRQPFACELMDKTILDCTKDQRMYSKDRAFIKGDPTAILLVSFVHEQQAQAVKAAEELIHHLERSNLRSSSTIITENVDRIWNLRKAGLGLLANLPGDKKAVACIEDTAVAIEDLSAYISEFSSLMERYGQKSVYYAHAGAGEIHLRPILDLKKTTDRALFEKISRDSAALVKKYNGSLSGEHGDGRVRAPFIKDMYGDTIYRAFCTLKDVWDPQSILNPGKIVRPKSMLEDLRFDIDHKERTYESVFDFSEVGGILRAAEKCNGSGDCRKLPLSGGTMCPSYMATRNEKDTTRARANVLREVLTRPNNHNPWTSEVVKDAMDLCLSCKGCISECPSNVDMSTLKAEFLHHHYNTKGFPFRSRIFAHFASLSKWMSKLGVVNHFLLENKWTSALMKKVSGIHPSRSFPSISGNPLKKRLNAMLREKASFQSERQVTLFIDEFSNYNDPEIGVKGVELLMKLGYNVNLVDHMESGRAAISKGMLMHAKKCAEYNVEVFFDKIDDQNPLIGIEPSTILSFIDEYPRLVGDALKEKAKALAKNVFTIESFLYREFKRGHIQEHQFDDKQRSILVHGHCHQKALTDIHEVAWLLSIPKGHSVELLDTGCCGMAGSFGYENEHYELSMTIGELVLFPSVRKSAKETYIAASGTSCRHQIKDGTNKSALHPIEILHEAILVE